MQTVLDELQSRLESAKKRHGDAALAFQKAQVDLQSATNELNVWNAAVGIEVREIERRTAEARASQMPLPTVMDGTANPEAKETTTSANAELPQTGSPQKTALVRDLIRQNSAGITVDELWRSTKTQIGNRTYLYSILKRMRDRDEVILRRKKYFLKAKPMEVHAGSESTLVQ